MTLVRNDILGISQKSIPIKKLANNLGIEDQSLLQNAIDALEYLILHIAKVNASQEEFYIIYE